MTYLEFRTTVDEYANTINHLESILQYDDIDHENTIESLDYHTEQLRLLVTAHPLWTAQYIIAMHINRNN